MRVGCGVGESCGGWKEQGVQVLPEGWDGPVHGVPQALEADSLPGSNSNQKPTLMLAVTTNAAVPTGGLRS